MTKQIILTNSIIMYLIEQITNQENSNAKYYQSPATVPKLKKPVQRIVIEMQNENYVKY